MRQAICYTKTERFWLAALGVFGFFAVNGAFAYGLLFQPDAMTAAWTNPLAAAFMVVALPGASTVAQATTSSAARSRSKTI